MKKLSQALEKIFDFFDSIDAYMIKLLHDEHLFH